MRIAIDCRLIGQSGIGTFIENIVRHTVDIPHTDYVLIGDKNILACYASKKNCMIIDCRHKSFTLKELFLFPTKEINQCDAFFTPNFNIPMGIKVPIFSTIHDVVFFDVKGFCTPFGKLIRWLYIKRALSISKAVFTVSLFSKSRIESLFHPNCPILVCYSGISEELRQYVKDHSPIAPTEKKDNLVFLGNLKKNKGLHTLIPAYRTLLKNPENKTTLTIIGNIDFRTKDKEIQNLINDNDNRIIFLRGASNEQVFKELAEAKALISPSEYEGLGLPPMEAMFLGTPAIISDIPVYREIYGDTPVRFFKKGDVEDLARQLKDIPSFIPKIEKLVDGKHNFYHITTFIIKSIIHSKV